MALGRLHPSDEYDIRIAVEEGEGGSLDGKWIAMLVDEIEHYSGENTRLTALLAERDALRARADSARLPCARALEYRDGVTCRDEWDSRGVCLNHRVIEGLRVHAVTADRLEIENRALRRQVRVTYGIIHEGLHGGKATDPDHQEACEMPSCRNARAALAAASEGLPSPSPLASYPVTLEVVSVEQGKPLPPDDAASEEE